MKNEELNRLIKQAGIELRMIELNREISEGAEPEQRRPILDLPPYIPTRGVPDAFANLRKQEIGNYYED